MSDRRPHSSLRARLCHAHALRILFIGIIVGFVLILPGFADAQNTGLVAAYSFDENSGTTVADASGNGNSGTIFGATWSAQGKFGSALSFDGVNDRVTASPVTLGPSFTLMAWVLNPTNEGYETIMTVGSNRDLYLGNGVIAFYDGGA
ncbi:MAG TPA: hypothetical protein VJO34_17255, partial [Methylomirabilota bacterium]|nr:hypothetical protein [Methylomirabilota bacterium]